MGGAGSACVCTCVRVTLPSTDSSPGVHAGCLLRRGLPCGASELLLAHSLHTRAHTHTRFLARPRVPCGSVWVIGHAGGIGRRAHCGGVGRALACHVSLAVWHAGRDAIHVVKALRPRRTSINRHIWWYHQSNSTLCGPRMRGARDVVGAVPQPQRWCAPDGHCVVIRRGGA